MKISFWPYLLQPKTSLNAVSNAQARQGFLLKVEDPRGAGYADLHPWTEFGDVSCSDQLRLMKAGNPSALAQRSLELAEKDLLARAQKRSLSPSGLRNNFLVSNLETPSASELREKGFRTLKMKCGRRDAAEVAFIEKIVSETDFRLRLDFNSVMTFERFVQFGQRLSVKARAAIEYIEDPIPYEAAAWRALREEWTLALDFEGKDLSLEEPVEADVFIYKPAREKMSRVTAALQQGMKVTVTSMMDHPVGVMHALVSAREISEGASLLELGCATLDVYEPTEFHAGLRQNGAFFESAPGLGIGFEDLLASLDWRAL